MTPSGIEPATFRLVAQCFNQLRHRVPHIKGTFLNKKHIFLKNLSYYQVPNWCALHTKVPC
jgi:hypothetical protein